jgi:hypothetical protein
MSALPRGRRDRRDPSRRSPDGSGRRVRALTEGDEWPQIRERILAAEILVVATPTWIGQPSTVFKRALEPMDAFLSEMREDGETPVAPNRVAGVVVGDEDGAHHCISEIRGALIDSARCASDRLLPSSEMRRRSVKTGGLLAGRRVRASCCPVHVVRGLVPRPAYRRGHSDTLTGPRGRWPARSDRRRGGTRRRRGRGGSACVDEPLSRSHCPPVAVSICGVGEMSSRVHVPSWPARCGRSGARASAGVGAEHRETGRSRCRGPTSARGRYDRADRGAQPARGRAGPTGNSDSGITAELRQREH